MQTTKISDMDIYSYINSKDIGEHCRKINHKFNPLEAAYIIWRSQRRTLQERHTAWKELIDTTTDMPIPDTKYKSLHEFLNSYMEMENDFLEEFCTADDNSVYFCRVYTNDGEYTMLPQENVFKTVEDCFKYIYELKNYIDIIDFWITKAPLNKQKDIAGIPFRSDFEPYRIINTLSETDLFITFCIMCPVVPTPFKKGDIVQIYNYKRHKNRCSGYAPKAFVLDTIGYWNISDSEAELNQSTNYCTILYSSDTLENNAISYTQIPDGNGASNEIETWGWRENYLDLEYYNGELKDRERILVGISNYLQGKINLSFLMNTYSVMNLDELSKDMKCPRGNYGWCDTPFKLGGWTDKEIKKFSEWEEDILKEIENEIYGEK